MAKSAKKIEARGLRRAGDSIKEIAKKISVSTSSVSIWCRDIELTNEQQNYLKKRQIDPTYGKRREYYLRKKKEFDNKVLELKKSGVASIGSLSKRDVFLVGIALYWGEGFKKDHLVGLASSDTRISKFFVFWLRTCFDISYQDLILRVTANNAFRNKVAEMEKHWSKELNIPLDQFSKPYFQKSIWKKEYENKDGYNGVLRIKVRRSVNLLRKIYGYIEGVSLSTGRTI